MGFSTDFSPLNALGLMWELRICGEGSLLPMHPVAPLVVAAMRGHVYFSRSAQPPEQGCASTLNKNTPSKLYRDIMP